MDWVSRCVAGVRTIFRGLFPEIDKKS